MCVLTSTVVIVVGAKAAKGRLLVVVGAEAPEAAGPKRHDGLPGRGARVRSYAVTIEVRGGCGRVEGGRGQEIEVGDVRSRMREVVRFSW